MKRFENILCVVEPNNSSIAAIAQATALAKSHQAKLTVVSVVKKPSGVLHNLLNQRELEKSIKDILPTIKKEIEAFVAPYCQGIMVNVDVLIGISFIEIIKDVIRNNRDLLVKCCQNESWVDRLFSSDEMHIFRKCPCPVLMLKSEKISPCSNILAAIDLADEDFGQDGGTRVQGQLNDLVIEYSLLFALAESADLHIGSVWEAYGESFLRYGTFSQMSDEKVDQYVEQGRREYVNKIESLTGGLKSLAGSEAVDYIRPRSHLVKGRPAEQIPVMAEKYNIDLIVMGTVARTGIPGMIIGNTAETILEQVKCSVLAIKPNGFKSPVLLS